MKHQNLLFVLLFVTQGVLAQTKFQTKAEISFLNYYYRSVRVDPGPNWKGYNLNDKQNGVQIASINGLSFLEQKMFAGIGIGYLNFEGINGASFFANVEYIPLKTRLSPLIDIRAGQSVIWIDGKDKRGTGLLDLGLGANYRINNKNSLYLKSGFSLTQQSVFVPLTIGYRR